MIINDFLTRNIQCNGNEIINIFNIKKPGNAIFGGINSWNFINGTYVKTLSMDEIKNVKLKKNEVIYGKDIMNRMVINTFGNFNIIDFHISLDSDPIHIDILINDDISNYKRDELYSLVKDYIEE